MSDRGLRARVLLAEAATLVKPPRRASRRRPLDDTETCELVDAVRATSRDPDLDPARSRRPRVPGLPRGVAAPA